MSAWGQVDILLGMPLRLSRLARARRADLVARCSMRMNTNAWGQVDILLGTPLRLSRLAKARRADLASVRDVVCDEADQLLGGALLAQVDRVLAACRRPDKARALQLPARPQNPHEAHAQGASMQAMQLLQAARDAYAHIQFCCRYFPHLVHAIMIRACLH